MNVICLLLSTSLSPWRLFTQSPYYFAHVSVFFIRFYWRASACTGSFYEKMHYLKARGSTLRVLAMNLFPVIIAAVAANQLSLLFRNIDQEDKMAVYFKNDEGMEKLESVP